MRLARVTVGAICDFALQSSTGEWVPFASVGSDAGTTAEAIESWKPKRSVIQPPALQPHAASRIHTSEPRTTASTR